MAASDVHLCFTGGTSPSVGGVTFNESNGGSGTVWSDALQEDGNASGISLAVATALTGGNQGYAAGANAIIIAMNTEGSYTSGSTQTFTFTFPPSITSVDIRVNAATTYTFQDEVDYSAQGANLVTYDNWKHTFNADGDTFTLVGCQPDGSNQIVLTITNNTGSYIFHNGFSLLNIQGGTQTHTGSGNLSASPASVSAQFQGGIAAAIGASPASTNATVTVLGNATQNDDFSGSGELGAPWQIYNPNSAPISPVRDSGYYRADITDNTNQITAWFNGYEGRFDYVPVRFPVGVTPNEYHFLGVGVGPTGANFRDNLPYASHFQFCGPMAKSPSFNDYMFAVIGHRGTEQQFTIETKSTNRGVSTVGNEGDNAVGVGISFCDFGVELHNTGQVLFKYKPVGGPTWTYINGGSGLTPAGQPDIGGPGDIIWLGLVTYAWFTGGVPFTGSCDEFVVFTEDVNTVSGSGALQVSPAALSAVVRDITPDQFTLIADVTGAEVSTAYSGSFVIGGVTDGLTLNVVASGAASMQVSLDNVNFSTSVSAVNGNTIYYRLTSSASFNTQLTGTVSINGISDSLVVTTRSATDPSITTQPQSQSVEAGQQASFSVVATNANSYQWYRDGVAVSGATSSTYAFTTVQVDDGATFYVVVTSTEGGTTQSVTVTLSIAANVAPTITGNFVVSITENTALSETYAIPNRDGALPTLTGPDAALFSIVNISGDDFRLTMTARDYENPTDADTNNVYQVTININDLVNPLVTQAVSVTVTDLTETAPAIITKPIAVWGQGTTPNLTTGDPFFRTLTLYHGDNEILDFSGATSAKVAIVSEDHSYALTGVSEVQNNLSGADWQSGILTAYISGTLTAQAREFITKKTLAKIEIEITINGNESTWYAPINIVPGFIN